jgi:hypothetical protein
MLAYFPTPYPDELLFSVVSRLADVMQYPRSHDLSRAIYGGVRRMVWISLPSHIDSLITALPPGHAFTTDRVIGEQTLFPFYQPFLLTKSAQTLEARLRGKEGTRGSAYTGIALKSVPPAQWLRFCYECVRADREQYGECYWHRIHQVPGVQICPEHGAIIQDSEIPAYHRLYRHRYISAERALTNAEPRPNHLTGSSYQLCWMIAKDAEWLLNNWHRHTTPQSIQDRFYLVLADKGLASYTRTVRAAAFLRAFQCHYPPDLLDLLGCAIDYVDARAWPVQVISRVGQRHPLQYLLVMHFLGHTAESFFALPTRPAYFGEGPWPCLNPACQYYKQPVIETCEIDYQARNTQPRATFSCTCGFVYRRVGPDTKDADRFRIGRVVRRGPVWEARFRQLWNDPDVSKTQMARQLRIEQNTLVQQASQLGESRPGQDIPVCDTETLARHRNLWLAALSRSPTAHLSELREEKTLEGTYRWLMKNDRDWYEGHKPDSARKTVKRGEKSRYPDYYWKNRDVQLAEEIRLAALHLLQQPGKPVRVSQKAIFSYLNQESYTSRPAKLPLASLTLAALVEPYEVFVIRRLEWVIQQYRTQGISPTKGDVSREAGVDCFRKAERRKFAYKVLDDLISGDAHASSLIHDFFPSGQRDWRVLDAQLPELVQRSARKLKREPGYPVQVTVATIGAEIGELEVLLCHLGLLPQTAQMLAEVVETPEEFAGRVFDWMEHAADAECSHRTEFIRLSGLKLYMRIPAVARLVDERFSRVQAQNRPGDIRRRVDWIDRDRKLAPAVRKAASLIRNQPDPPRRINRASISEMVDTFGILNVKIWELLVNFLDRLPETRKALEEAVETPEQFTRRRLYAIARRFRAKGLRPTQTQLLRGASAEAYAASPLIRETISEIVESLAWLPSASEAAKRSRWEELDNHLASLVEPAARQLQSQTDPPMWVTQSAIAEQIGYQFRPTNLEKLPKTARKLAQIIETQAEFGMRRMPYL